MMFHDQVILGLETELISHSVSYISKLTGRMGLMLKNERVHHGIHFS